MSGTGKAKSNDIDFESFQLTQNAKFENFMAQNTNIDHAQFFTTPPPQTNIKKFLELGLGNVIGGALGYNASIIEIASGAIDIGFGSGKFASHIIVQAETGTTDTLTDINNFVYSYQDVTIQADTGDVITLTETGNIFLGDSISSITLNSNEQLRLRYDIRTDKWRAFVGAGTGGGGGFTDPLTQLLITVPPVTLPFTTQIDTDVATEFQITLDRNIEFDIVGGPAIGRDEVLTVFILQNGTGGFTIDWGTNVTNPPDIGLDPNESTTVVLVSRDQGNTWTVESAASGGSGQTQTPWLSDIDAATFDLFNLDRLRFTSDSGGVVSDDDPSIFLDGNSNMVYNLADQKQYFWTMNNRTRMQLAQSGTNNDTILTVETDFEDASAIPFFNIFRDDPTPAKDTEITNIQFIGRHAATNGGAAVGDASVYSKIVTEYENVITNREAASLNFFTSFDTGTTTLLKSFLGLNNENSEEIDAFVDVNLNEKNIRNVADIKGIDDDTTQFQIIFDAGEDSDTSISNQNGELDRINVFAGGINGTFFFFNTTNSEYQMGIPNDVAAYWSVGNHRLEFDAASVPLDAVIGNDSGVVFLDTSTDPPILKIKKKSSTSVVSIVSLEAGGGATSLNDLTDVTITSVATNNVLSFTGTVWENVVDLSLTTIALSSFITTPQIGFSINGNIIDDDAGGMNFKTPVGDEFTWSDGSTDFALLDIGGLFLNSLFLQLNSISQPTDTIGFNVGKIYMDTDNLNHLSILRDNLVTDLESHLGNQDATPFVDPTSGNPLVNTDVYMSNSKQGLDVSNNTAAQEDVIVYVPIYIGQRTNIDRLAWVKTDAVSAGSITWTIAIYDSVNAAPNVGANYPGARLVEGSTTSDSTQGIKFIGISPITLEPGLYWLAHLITNTTAGSGIVVSARHETTAANSVGYFIDTTIDRLQNLLGFSESEVTTPDPAPAQMSKVTQDPLALFYRVNTVL